MTNRPWVGYASCQPTVRKHGEDSKVDIEPMATAGKDFQHKQSEEPKNVDERFGAKAKDDMQDKHGEMPPAAEYMQYKQGEEPSAAEEPEVVDGPKATSEPECPRLSDNLGLWNATQNGNNDSCRAMSKTPGEEPKTVVVRSCPRQAKEAGCGETRARSVSRPGTS